MSEPHQCAHTWDPSSSAPRVAHRMRVSSLQAHDATITNMPTFKVPAAASGLVSALCSVADLHHPASLQLLPPGVCLPPCSLTPATSCMAVACPGESEQPRRAQQQPGSVQLPGSPSWPQPFLCTLAPPLCVCLKPALFTTELSVFTLPAPASRAARPGPRPWTGMQCPGPHSAAPTLETSWYLPRSTQC